MAYLAVEGGFFQEGPGTAVELNPKKVLWTVARCFFLWLRLGLGLGLPRVFISGFTRCLVCVLYRYLWVYQVKQRETLKLYKQTFFNFFDTF